jgi:hypothetical protein
LWTYNRKLAQLHAFAAAGQTDAKPAPNLAELEAESARPAKQNRYAYGELARGSTLET